MHEEVFKIDMYGRAVSTAPKKKAYQNKASSKTFNKLSPHSGVAKHLYCLTVREIDFNFLLREEKHVLWLPGDIKKGSIYEEYR